MTTKSTRYDADNAGPFWAVLGAPLVGVPLMVAFLALGSGTAAEAAAEPDSGFAVEHAALMDTRSEPEADSFHRD